MPRNWQTIKDDDVVHIWRDSEGDEHEIPPTFYAEGGTPVCPVSGDDMTYVRTEIFVPEVEAPLPTGTYTVIWRIGSEEAITVVNAVMPSEDRHMDDPNEWLRLAVQAHVMELYDDEGALEEFERQMAIAFNVDDPEYKGYELLGVIYHANGEENLPWVAI